MTTLSTIAALAAACAALGGCGGSGDSPPPAPPPAPPAPQTYNYIAPTVGESDTWTRILTDSAGSRVTLQLRQRVTSVDGAGTMVFTWDDPTGVDVVQDGVEFRTTPETAHVAANGGTLDYTVTHTDGTQATCVYGQANPDGTAAAAARAQAEGLRHADSLQVGESWTTAYTIACGTQAAVTFHVSASVTNVESVIVGAGTFLALKEHVYTTYLSNGFTNVTDVTLWRDPARSLFPVMVDESIQHGDPSTPYIAHETRELLSRD